MSAALLPRLGPSPDLLVVQGDTSSALGAALAGFDAGVPVAHVEAGLRTHDPRRPWPEEEYRTAIDAQARLLFAPTELAAANLRSERVPGNIHVTGNTGIDALLAAGAMVPARAVLNDRGSRILVTCHRRESWGDGLAGIASAVTAIARSAAAEVELVMHPNPMVAAGMRALLGQAPGVSLVEPCGHCALIARMRAATLVMSDSGGIQEEAPALGVPLLVLRDKTERPEGIASGNMRLVGTQPERIIEEALRLLGDPRELAAMSRPALPYGDGKAAPRIAAIIEEWLRTEAAFSQKWPAVPRTAGFSRHE